MLLATFALVAHVTQVAAVAPADIQPLLVRTYDAYGVSDAVLAEAHDAAADILRDAGILAVWTDCKPVKPGPVVPIRLEDPAVAGPPPTSCDHAPAPAELSIRIVRASETSERDSLGYSLVDVRRKAGSLATIFQDRIERLSAHADYSTGRLMGRAMAHEIGHLLLGTSTHAGHGLMRSDWTTTQLRRDLPWDWLFSAKEAGGLRRSIASRFRQAIQPDWVVADLLTDRFSDRR